MVKSNFQVLKILPFKFLGSPTSCYFDSFTQVNFTCSGQSNCSINGNPSFEKMSNYQNACKGYSNMLYVQWECVPILKPNQTVKAVDSTKICYQNDSYSPVGKCPSSSSFEPNFLPTSTLTSFNYPIYEKITCTGGKVVIKCLENFVIHIYSAYYGIQSKTLTNCIKHQSSEIPAKCYYPSIFRNISHMCDNRNECEIKATCSFFDTPDVCPHNAKQLFIQYQCVNSYALRNTISQCSANDQLPLICPSSDDANLNQETWCSINNASIEIACQKNQTIEIVCAFYGLHPSIQKCALPIKTPICYFNSSLETTKSNCNDLSSCSFKYSDFMDPCVGFNKALFISWKCK